MRTDGPPGLFTTLDYGRLFQFLARGLVDVFFSRGFSHARLIHFLFDASECRLVGFLLGIGFMHTCTMSRGQRDYRSIWNTLAVSELSITVLRCACRISMPLVSCAV